MSGYTKLFGSILESTIWLETPPIKVVWITLLAMADRDGVVEASLPGLAKRAGVDRSQCEQALATFLAPDPDSRTPDNEGRRIIPVAGGWRLLNYETYREKASADEGREKAAARKRRQRERQAASRVTVTHVTESHDIAEAVQQKAEAVQPAEVHQPVLVSRARGSRRGRSNGNTEDDALSTRAGRLREELYPAWYALYRHGARLRLVANSLEYHDALTIVQTWEDARIERLAKVFLTTDEDWISRTDRSFRIFASKATWCDDRLRQVEQQEATR